MESVVGFIGYVLRQLAFEAVFFWLGWLVLNILTLGRYPRLRKPQRNVDDYMEIQFIVMVGVLSVFGLAVFVVKFWSGSGQA